MTELILLLRECLRHAHSTSLLKSKISRTPQTASSKAPTVETAAAPEKLHEWTENHVASHFAPSTLNGKGSTASDTSTEEQERSAALSCFASAALREKLTGLCIEHIDEATLRSRRISLRLRERGTVIRSVQELQRMGRDGLLSAAG